jgi:hypothetical protein
MRIPHPLRVISLVWRASSRRVQSSMSTVGRLLKLIVAGPRRITDALFGYDFFICYAHDDGDDYPQALDKELSV